MIRAIIFDFDGVLVESVNVKTQAFRDLYADYGAVVVEKVVGYHLEHGGISRFEKFKYCHRNFLGKEICTEELQKLGNEFSLRVKEAVIKAPWVSGAHGFLIDYHNKLPLFVASGTPDDEIREIIERRDMSRFFVSVMGSPASKAEIMETFCGVHQFNRDRVLMVGDSLTDYEGARASGIRFIGRTTLDRNPFPPEVIVLEDLRTLARHC